MKYTDKFTQENRNCFQEKIDFIQLLVIFWLPNTVRCTDLRYSCTQPWNLQVWIRWWRSISLHSNEPGGRKLLRILQEIAKIKQVTQQRNHYNDKFTIHWVCYMMSKLCIYMYTILDLTWPSGIPRAVFSSSERFPGFFSFSLVSNSFPYCIKNKDWMIKEHNSLHNIEINHTTVIFKYKYNPSTRNTCTIRILQTKIHLSIPLILHNTSWLAEGFKF